jgi:hypothetical protein
MTASLVHDCRARRAMIHERCIPIDSKEAWDTAVSGLPHSICHTWGYCHSVWLSSRPVTFLYCLDDDDIRIVCPLSEREYDGATDVVTPYGMGGFTGSGDGRAVAAHWSRFATHRGYICGYIALNPLFAGPSYRGAETFREKTTYVLDLRLTEDQLFAALPADRKQRLRIANTRIARDLIWDRAAITEFFATQYSIFMDSKMAAPVFRLSPASLRSLCGLESVLLIGAGQRGRVEAAAMFGHTPFSGDYLFAFSLPGSQKYSAGLLWWAVRSLKKLGVPFLNLGGGLREGDRLAEFKRRFSGLELPVDALRQVYRQNQYEALCRRTGVDPTDASGYFPAYHRPR